MTQGHMKQEDGVTEELERQEGAGARRWKIRGPAELMNKNRTLDGCWC